MALLHYSSPPTPILLGCIFVVWLFGSYVFAWFRLRHIKGPFLASFSYLWILRTTTAWQQYDRYGDLFGKYGKLVRIGPNDVITATPDVIHRMSSARSRYKRSDYYKGARVNPMVESLLNLIDNHEHDKLKGQMAYGYGGKEVPTLEHDVDEQIHRLVDVLRSKYASAKKFAPMDLATLSQYFTLDVITKVSYGKEFGHLETESDVIGYIKSSTPQLKLAVICSEIPFFRKLFMNPLVLRFFGPRPSDKTGFGKLIGTAKQIVSKRFEQDAEDQQDMLGSFIRHGVSQNQCEAEVPLQIIVGSDTTAHAIRATFLYLMSTVHAYRKLQDEVDAAASRGTISHPATTEEGRQLPYLQGVIYEGLRLNPPATALLMKEAPPEGDTIDGYFIPGGTRVAISIKPIMMDTTVFGDDAEAFRPERWLNLEPEQRRRMVDTVEMVFGSGRWGCSGKYMAFIELNKIFIELLRNFDFQLLNPWRPVEERTNVNIWLEKGMWVKVTERSTLDSE